MNKSILLFSLINLFALMFVNSSPAFDVSKLKVAEETDNIMIVVPLSYESFSAYFYYYIKEGDKWKEIMSTEARIGLNGLGKEREGDKRTPIGKFIFNCYFGIKDNPGTTLPYVKITESMYWNGDSNSDKYNLLVDYNNYTNFDTYESEHLIEVNPGYEYAMNMNYNEERTPYKGAGIFLHCYTERIYTAGCVALPEEDMKTVLTKANKKSVIIIDVLKNIENY